MGEQDGQYVPDDDDRELDVPDTGWADDSEINGTIGSAEQIAAAYVALDDRYALAGVRLFANPEGGDPAIVSGETGASGLAALLAARDVPALTTLLGLGADSRVLLLGSEGDTDPAIYQEITGRSAEEVRG